LNLILVVSVLSVSRRFAVLAVVQVVKVSWCGYSAILTAGVMLKYIGAGDGGFHGIAGDASSLLCHLL